MCVAQPSSQETSSSSTFVAMAMQDLSAERTSVGLNDRQLSRPLALTVGKRCHGFRIPWQTFSRKWLPWLQPLPDRETDKQRRELMALSPSSDAF